MDGDMNDIVQKLNSMLSDEDTSENLKNILNNFASSSSNDHSSSNDNSEGSDRSSSSTNPEFDINTILKIQSIMKAMNNKQDDARANLLRSLKPYMKDSKKNKIDQYIKFLSIARVFETMNPLGGDTQNE